MKRVICGILLPFLLSLAVNAQTVTARIQGSVTDPSGAVVPNVLVSLENYTTKEIRKTRTTDAGEYVFENVAPGKYKLTAESPGFKQTVQVIDVAVQASVTFDLVLNVSRASETVTVAAEGRGQAEPPEKNYATVRIFYATDRRRSSDSRPEYYYTGLRAENENLSYGFCDVSIPRDHQMGKLEAPSALKFQLRKDPEKHIVVLSVTETPYDGFFRRVSKRVASSQEKQAFVFIHGYNVTFEDAARRTAQLSYDLGFDGAPILYSWPSQACISCYPADEDAIEWTSSHLRKFLEDVAAKSGATTIHLIAHSMGNRALSSALQAIADERSVNPLPRFQQVVLAAPDIGVKEFMDLAEAIKQTCNRITLYASSKDKALALSEWLHHATRLGEAGAGMVILSVMDTIDVSSLDTDLLGHSYYGDNTSVLSDIFRLLRWNSPPDQRCGLVQKWLNNQSYWAFDRAQADGCIQSR